MRSLLHVIVAVAVTASASMAIAGDGPGGKSHCDGRCIVRCPNCCHECVFSANKEKVTKSCYDVECKSICIPRIVFPWQKSSCTCGKGGKDGCCEIHNGAKAKSVRVLKKYEYECSKCKHKWTPISKCRSDKKAFDAERGESPETNAPPEPPPVEARLPYGKPVVEKVVSHTE